MGFSPFTRAIYFFQGHLCLLVFACFGLAFFLCSEFPLVVRCCVFPKSKNHRVMLTPDESTHAAAVAVNHNEELPKSVDTNSYLNKTPKWGSHLRTSPWAFLEIGTASCRIPFGFSFGATKRPPGSIKSEPPGLQGSCFPSVFLFCFPCFL